MHAKLLRRGESCSAEPVRALMREQGLVPAQVRTFRPTTTAQGAFRGIPDLVGRDFTATRPGLKLVGDITGVPHDFRTRITATHRSGANRNDTPPEQSQDDPAESTTGLVISVMAARASAALLRTRGSSSPRRALTGPMRAGAITRSSSMA
ncbi:integrase [Planomonospora sphaerica]|uniref:Integrase n=1 Tax=Planomonospora sphaerica TaxID=161355 RepID=A0A171DKV1_9ACTN|nr:integrase [Planomonospora sphaerica]